MNKNNSLFNAGIYQVICQTACIYAFFILSFLAGRIIFLVSFGDGSLWHEKADVFRAFVAGTRFDTVVTLYALIPFVLVSCVGIAVKRRLTGLKTWITAVPFALFAILTVINFYYYRFFQDNINILAFGLLEDDTVAVLTSVWTDYPLVFILLMLAAVSFAAFKCLKRIVSREFHLRVRPALYGQIVSAAVFLFLFVSGMRGTYSMFPLNEEDKTVCGNSFINKIAGNGAFDLQTAVVMKINHSIKAVEPGESAGKYGFASAAGAVSVYLDRHVENSPDSIVSALTVRSAHSDFLAQNPPNVVVLMVESMNMYFMSLNDSENFNLLGELADVLPETYLFDHCVPSTGGTINTLEYLTVNNCLSPVSQSKFYSTPYTAATALPFYSAGYETCFFTSARIGWRNVNSFLSHQYFRNIAGAEAIAGAYPDCRSGSWGLFDEHLFDYVYGYLSAKPEHSPAYVFAMTTTNHSPYDMPDIVYDNLNRMPAEVEAMLITDSEIAMKSFKTYRYTNDCLGRFIKRIKSSPLGKNTVIAITGDHNSRGIINYADSKKLQKYGVPIIFSVPDGYRTFQDTAVDTHCFASHRDIFPTVYNLALSDAKYVKSGVNLFSGDARNSFGICEFSILFDRNGCLDLAGNQCMSWTSSDKTELQLSEYSPQCDEIIKRGNAYLASMVYLMELDLWK